MITRTHLRNPFTEVILKNQYYLAVLHCFLFLICNNIWSQEGLKEDYHIIEVNKAQGGLDKEGMINMSYWSAQNWLPLDNIWLGSAQTKEDFSGRYKLLWNDNALYLLAEIQDDVLLDRFNDPLKRWWDEDCLEIFIDEDNSGGNHQFNHSAFAYHIDLKGNVVDVNPEKQGQLYNSHVISRRVTTHNTTIWEVKILLFDNNYVDDSYQEPQRLVSGKKIGFALAYCDNDTSEHRESFIGSSQHPGFKNDLGWKDASIFQTILLKD